MLLVVQMGHSGRTSGKTGAPGERDFTEAVGAACFRLLNGRGGWSVRLIAADVAASEYRGDGFVAVHADGSTNPGVRGASYGYQTVEGRSAAEGWAAAWRESYDGPWNPPNYTTNLAQYYGVREAVAAGNRRAFILEAGTITNAEDRVLLTSIVGVESVARSVGAAFGIPVEEDELTAQFEADMRAWTRDRSGNGQDFGDFAVDVRADLARKQQQIDDMQAAVARVEDVLARLDGLGALVLDGTITGSIATRPRE